MDFLIDFIRLVPVPLVMVAGVVLVSYLHVRQCRESGRKVGF